MGCTDSAEVIQNKNKQRPAFNMLQNNSFIQGEDLYLMGQIDEDKHIFATITTSRIPASLLNPQAKQPITLKDLPKVIDKPMKIQQIKEHQSSLPIYKPYNFSQMVRLPEQTNSKINNQQCWYLITGGINYKLSDITSNCVLFNSKYHIAQKLPSLNQHRYTHCCTIFQGWAYVLGGRQFGQDDSAILNSCQKFNLKDLEPIISQSKQHNNKENKWMKIASMNKSRCTFFTLIHQRKIWVVGGYTGEFERSTLLEYYQPGKQDIWKSIQVQLPFGIQSVIPLVSNKNQITIFGGNSNSGAMDTVLILNMFEKNIKASHKMKQKRLLHKSSFNANQNCIYMFGGNQNLDVQIYKLKQLQDLQEQKSTIIDINLKKYFKDQEHFQSLTHTQSVNYLPYSPISSIPVEHVPSETDEIVYILGTSYQPFILELNISVPYTLYHPIPLEIQMHALQGGIYLKKNMFMILGGITDSMDQVSSKVFIYDAKNKKGKQIQAMIQSRYAFAYEKLNNYIYAVGGGTADSQGQLTLLNKVQRLNIENDIYEAKWEQIADLPQSLISPMSLNYNNCLYIFGGLKKNNERNEKIYKYNQSDNSWKQISFKLPFGIQASSIIRNSENEFLIFGGRLNNGDSSGIWSLSFIENGENCVFVEKGQMKQPKCLHKTYKPSKQNFFVIFGGQNEALSYYDCQNFQPIESDILLGMKMIFLKSLESLEEHSLKNYLILSKN